MGTAWTTAGAHNSESAARSSFSQQRKPGGCTEARLAARIAMLGGGTVDTDEATSQAKEALAHPARKGSPGKVCGRCREEDRA